MRCRRRERGRERGREDGDTEGEAARRGNSGGKGETGQIGGEEWKEGNNEEGWIEDMGGKRGG